MFAVRWTTHGHARPGVCRSVEYSTWARIVARCENPKNPAFNDYGGRGIRVCARWRASFSAFLADMGYRPDKGYSIERLNVNGHYEPGNCTWATAKQQARNRRSSRFVSLDGETLSVAEWSERTGICSSTIIRRLNEGWPPERALGPLQRRGPSPLPLH